MFKRLFPSILGKDYHGSWAALWLLLPVLLMKTLIGVNFSGFNPIISIAEVLKSADGVPMDSFTPEVSQYLETFANAWGVALLMLCLFVWLAVLRYRSALPLAILLLLLEQLGRTGSGIFKLLERMAGGSMPTAPGGYINLGMTAILLIAMLLSLRNRRAVQPMQ
jgi:hypothetical protein